MRCIALIPENVLHTQNVSLSPLENFLQHFEKNHLPKTTVLGSWQIAKLVTVFVKTENFSFIVDKILQNCRRAILKLQKDSPESEEHSRYLQSISGVSRNNFQTHFQKSYFFEKPFFCLIGIWPIFRVVTSAGTYLDRTIWWLEWIFSLNVTEDSFNVTEPFNNFQWILFLFFWMSINFIIGKVCCLVHCGRHCSQ